MIYIYCFFKGVLQLIFSGLLLVEATKTNSVLGIFQNSIALVLKCILQISLLPCPVWTWKWMFSMWHHFLLVGRIYALGTSSKLDLPTVNSYCFFQWNVDCFGFLPTSCNISLCSPGCCFFQSSYQVTLLIVHGGFITSDDAFIQPFLEQLYCWGAPNLLVIFEMFYDLWIPVIRACDLRGLLLSLVEREVMNFQLQWKKDFFSCKLRQFKYADDNFKN